MEAQLTYNQALENSEALYWSKLYNCKLKLKSYLSNIAGGVACALPEIDILAYNRLVGIGLEKAVHKEDIDAIIDFFQQAGSRRFFVQVSPFAKPFNLEEMLKEKGFTYYNNWIKLTRPLHSTINGSDTSPVNIIKLNKSEADTYGQLIVKSFDWPDKLIEFFSSSVGSNGYTHYFALLEDIPIGAAALHIEGAFASMAIAGTLPEFRGLGVQKQLLTHRIKEAQEKGCSFAVTETGENLPARPNYSYQNMLKVGFKPEYIRKNYLYQF